MGQLGGDISLMPMADLIIWLANRQMSGVLAAELGTLRKEFVLERGSAVRASSNEPREYFGQFLIHYRLVNEDQLRRAFEAQVETKVRLGRILVMIDAVSQPQVEQVLKVKIAETLLDTFRWTSGRFVFTAEPPADANLHEVSVNVPLVDIHREGVARSGTWDQYHRVFGDPHLVLDVDEARAPEHLGPESLDGRIIMLARQGLTIEALALELHATDYQLASRLFDLHQAGVIHAREPSFTVPGPSLKDRHGRSYAELAREAMASDAYTEAMQHLSDGARQNPDDPTLVGLQKEVHDRAKAKMERELARYAVPCLARELSSSEKKRFTAKERYVLARIDGYRTVDAIIQLSPMHDIEALEILKSFQARGLIKL